MFGKDNTRVGKFSYQDDEVPRLARDPYQLRQGGYDERSQEQRRKDELTDQKELARLEYKEKLYDMFRPADELIGKIMTVSDPEMMAEELMPGNEAASTLGFAAGMLGPGKFKKLMEQGSEYLLKKGLAKNKKQALEMTRDDIIRRRARNEQKKLTELKPYKPKEVPKTQEVEVIPKMDLEKNIKLNPYIPKDSPEFKKRLQEVQRLVDDQADDEIILRQLGEIMEP